MDSIRQYRVGHTYRDTASLKGSGDQFLAWLNQPGSGMRNMSGVRPLKHIQLAAPTPAVVILVTGATSAGSTANPWEDVVDFRHGSVVYWGDAKFDVKRSVDDFPGNRALRDVWNEVLDGHVQHVPPILHFTRRETGYVEFTGLCVLERLDLSWYESAGKPVRNYRAHLAILDEEYVDVDWLQARVRANSSADLVGHGPKAWRRYQDGQLDRLRVWAPSIRATSDQLPPVGSPEAAVLDQLVGLSPTGFEAAVVAMLAGLRDIHHEITRTQPSGDGGFDFFGSFKLPPPIRYVIPFRGEAKRYSRNVAVNPKDVSRLVARLGRGEFGLFVTTSYFTVQAQEEVLADGYPTELIAGADIVKVLRDLRLATGSTISPAWLTSVEAASKEPVSVLRRVAESDAPYGS
jgi:hypothetical protein